MTQLLTADFKPFCLGDVLWEAPYPQLHYNNRAPRRLATTPETMLTKDGILFTTDTDFPEPCIGEVASFYSSEQAANEAYITRINRTIGELEQERQRAKERRINRRFNVYVRDFDLERKSLRKRLLAAVLTEGTGVKPGDVLDALVKRQPALLQAYNPEKQTIGGLETIVEEIEG